ncbi:MAG: sulfotransferase domain-containing protein [Pseudomarimonas sp.]
MKQIIWLASYPKSGNTWFRVFLSNLVQRRMTPVNINELQDIGMASGRQLFDEWSGVAASDLSLDEVEDARPSVYEAISQHSKADVFFKIHDALTCTSSGQPIVSARASKAAIYFIRNPLDVAVSFAHHSSWTLDKSIAAMNDPDYSFAGSSNKFHTQLRQRLLSWSEHVRSWTEHAYFPTLLLRYEDMQATPLATFKTATEFADIACSDEEIARALAFSDIRELQQQESLHGFKEKKFAETSRFFRKGKVGSWRDELSTQQVNQVIANHRDVMQKFGYLDAI